MIGAAILFALLAAIAWRIFAAGATAADLKARYADEKKEAEDAREIATFQQRRADLERDARQQSERVAALDAPALADDLRMLLADPFASDPRPAATAPGDAPAQDDGDRRA